MLLLQGNTGTGANWLRPSLADELFAPGQPLDAAEYFIIMPDAIGRGGSSKPSDGLKGNFPHYRYYDMVESGYQLITEGLDVAHLRLIIGSSMGGMHAWMWAERVFAPAATQGAGETDSVAERRGFELPVPLAKTSRSLRRDGRCRRGEEGQNQTRLMMASG